MGCALFLAAGEFERGADDGGEWDGGVTVGGGGAAGESRGERSGFDTRLGREGTIIAINIWAADTRASNVYHAKSLCIVAQQFLKHFLKCFELFAKSRRQIPPHGVFDFIHHGNWHIAAKAAI